jgi:hypothetical protein
MFSPASSANVQNEPDRPSQSLVGRKKKMDASSTMTRTMIVEIEVSRREGHFTFAVSARTCWRNVNGFVLDAIVCPRFYGA